MVDLRIGMGISEVKPQPKYTKLSENTPNLVSFFFFGELLEANLLEFLHRESSARDFLDVRTAVITGYSTSEPAVLLSFTYLGGQVCGDRLGTCVAFFCD